MPDDYSTTQGVLTPEGATPFWIRRSQRVVRMVSELHRYGYQRLRVIPYAHPLAWRLSVGPASGVWPSARWSTKDVEQGWPTYSSASGVRYFDWLDARHDTARQLADKFILRFPAVCAAGNGRDWEYAGWLLELLGAIEAHGALPIAFDAENPCRSSTDLLTLRRADGGEMAFPLPPPIRSPI